MFPRILLMTKHYRNCISFRKRHEQRSVFTHGFLWFCAAWNESPTIQTEPSMHHCPKYLHGFLHNYLSAYILEHSGECSTSSGSSSVTFSCFSPQHTALYYTEILVWDNLFKHYYLIFLGKNITLPLPFLSSASSLAFVLALDLSYLGTSLINSLQGKSTQCVIPPAQKGNCEVLTLWESPCFLATAETSPHVWSTSQIPSL